MAGARCLSAGHHLRLTRLPRHDRGPVPGGNRSAASCLCPVLRRALYHYATRSPRETQEESKGTPGGAETLQALVILVGKTLSLPSVTTSTNALDTPENTHKENWAPDFSRLSEGKRDCTKGKTTQKPTITQTQPNKPSFSFRPRCRPCAGPASFRSKTNSLISPFRSWNNSSTFAAFCSLNVLGILPRQLFLDTLLDTICLSRSVYHIFFPSNAFMASARSFNTFNCMLQNRFH